MESMQMGRNLGVERLQTTTGRLSFLFAVVGCLLIANPAHAQTCTTPADCDDGLFCKLDFCVGGNCFHTDNPCNDNLYCTVDFCNEATDSCEHTPVSCQAPTPYCSEALQGTCVECLQNGDCMVDPRRTCSAGVCVQCNDHGDCQDGFYCNGVESCNFTTGLCEPGTPVTCTQTCFMGTAPPGTTCTTDANCGTGGRCLGFCSELRATCVQCENNAGCDDGKFCDGQETCGKSGPTTDQCVVGTPPVCKKCVGGPTPGAACEVNATCGTGGTCTGSASFCDETNDKCQVCLTDGNCDDGLFCTTDDCTHLGSLNVCNHIVDPMRFCDDGVFCNGAEECNPTNTGCVNGTPPACQKTCFLGTVPHGTNCTTDTNCGSGGKCLGMCSETFRNCVQCEFNSTCNDGLFCNGDETCGPNGQCVAGTPRNCSNLDAPPCAVGVCNESTDQCVAQATNNGSQCDNNDHCTASSKCSNALCVNDPPATNDPYRCVRLEWRPSTPQTVTVGSTVTLSLYAVADGCNTPSDHCPANQHPVSSIEADISWDYTMLELIVSSPSNPNPQDPCNNSNSCNQCQTCTGGSNPGASCSEQCVGGANHGQVCFNSTQCPAGSCYGGPVCFGGTNNGNTCTTNGNCPGGGTCNTTGKCLGGGTCAPPTAYNWASSLFPNDCPSSQMNDPCPSLGFPGNDGDAYYQAIQPLSCSGGQAPPSCITPSGLPITNIKFKVLPGALGNTTISLLPCGPNPRRTGVQSTELPPPDYFTDDVLKSLGPPATINVVACTTDAQCNDNDGCTLDSCLANTCRNVPMPCQDTDPCTIDGCTNGACTHTPVSCVAGDVCYLGSCYKACSTDATCNDNIACTVDTCDLSPPPPIDGICRNIPSDALCDTGLFCDAMFCDAELGCTPDGYLPPNDLDCISSDGNPCPNPASCDEATNTCGGCYAPTVVAGGCRYLLVTPADQGSTSVALRVTGECGDPQSACVDRYVQSKCNGGTNNGINCVTDANCPKTCVGGVNPGVLCPASVPGGVNCSLGICKGFCDAGTLGPIPFYKLPSQWSTAKVRGAQIRPAANYVVETICRFPSLPDDVRSKGIGVTTWKWGDVDGNATVNGVDIASLVNKFKNVVGAVPFEQANLWACTPDASIDALDIVSAVDAFKGVAFSCSIVCP